MEIERDRPAAVPARLHPGVRSGRARGDSEGVAQSPSQALAPIGFEELELLPEVVVVPLINPSVGTPTPIPFDDLERRVWAWLPAHARSATASTPPRSSSSRP